MLCFRSCLHASSWCSRGAWGALRQPLRHFTGHILRSIGLVVLVVVVLGLLHLEMDTVFDMNAIRNSTQFLSWRHRSNLQECTGLVGPGTPGAPHSLAFHLLVSPPLAYFHHVIGQPLRLARVFDANLDDEHADWSCRSRGAPHLWPLRVLNHPIRGIDLVLHLEMGCFCRFDPPELLMAAGLTK